MNEDDNKQEFRETKDLKVDESQLNNEEKAHFSSPVKSFIIVFSIILVLIIICIIVIECTGGPIYEESNII